jgi:shikimate kinase
VSPKLIIIGLPAAGKTTAGRRLARRLGEEFADTDVLIEARAGRTVAQIFADDGESAFRVIEHQVVVESLTGFHGILALGGGAVLRADTRVALQASGVPIVHLVTSASAALRFVRDGQTRPLLRADPQRRLAELERERAPVYEALATVSVRSAGRPMSQVVDDLAQLIHPTRGSNS